MWTIVISCVASFAVCGPTGAFLPHAAGIFETQAQCEKELIILAKEFEPGRGAYTFNCRKLTDG